MILIKPKGYLYPSFTDESDCYIGVEGIPDSYNEYRLGSIFLRNFFIGLDYEDDSLHIGLRKDNIDAEIHGHAKNPNIKNESNPTLMYVVIFLAVLVIIAIACWIRSKRIEK